MDIDAGKVVMGDKEMAEELNKYFASDFTVEDTSIIIISQQFRRVRGQR